MISYVPLTELADWYPAFRQRQVDAYQAAGLPGPAAEECVDRLVEHGRDWTAVAITEADGQRVGQLVVGVVHPQGRVVGRIVDLWTEPAHDRHRAAAEAWARQWCEAREARRVAVRLVEPDPVFADYPLRSQTRCKALGKAPEPPAGVTVRPMTAAEYAGWAATEQREYAEDIVRAGSLTLAEALRQAEQEYAQLLPYALETPDTSILVLEAEGAELGVVWLKHGYLPGVSYLYSLLVHPEHRGRGFGRAAMAVCERASLAAGDGALMFNVFGGNEIAMNLYTKTGYAVLEESRSLDLDGS
ncbi:N-acetyltransferase [Streptomyces tateyamensis]|uniref:N-acetyltransferase n=1 Tax=Streptomyces tateyamensis TaxID=565073 RepID=A0A2V4NJG0_9ACTN|nr:GNAT family N-acetyltransferase [Streptomyces tateyamensis]PYC71880.1 N-acetyltransferase [Streptomyces tateyamensis]